MTDSSPRRPSHQAQPPDQTRKANSHSQLERGRVIEEAHQVIAWLQHDTLHQVVGSEEGRGLGVDGYAPVFRMLLVQHHKALPLWTYTYADVAWRVTLYLH